MKLVVGLGNPGNEYINTYHNIGFMFIDKMSEIYNGKKFKNKFDGLYFEKIINNEKVIFLKPLKYMNLSGEVVRAYKEFYKINIDDIIIICDDLDLPFGKIRLRYKGASGGHNGLKNIELNLKTNQYKRLKIGISGNSNIEAYNYVTSKISEEQKDILNKKFVELEKFIDDYLTMDFINLMNKYN